jgi:glutamyl-tRNA synthetase
MNEQTEVRVRFAPSPTGYLHVGGARTALFNWLFARHHGGAFVLRIEDTDRERSSDAMTDAILEGMTWLGLDWDEGPLHQADGLERHREDALRLLRAGHAYRCFCTPEQLAERRAGHPAGAGAFRYDRRCLALPAAESAARAESGEPHTVRVRVLPGTTRWLDSVHGEIAFDNADIEDFIILRSDATPIYNMAVVSDDIAMRITHVVRGDDHISNTPKQILLYVALGAALPTFAHVPMILGPDGKRLSKRHGATAVGEYHEQGILAEAMFNFLALLGWSPGTDEEILSRAEIVARFSLDNVNRKSAIFDATKLEWMNGRYLAALPAAELVDRLREFVDDAAAPRDHAWWIALVELLKVRSRTLREMAEQARSYITDSVEYEPDAVARYWRDAGEVADRLQRLRDSVARVQQWDVTTLETVLRALAEQLGVGAAKLIHPWRVSLTGAAASPGIFDVAALLGRERVLLRMDNAIAWLRRTQLSRVP